MEPTPIYTGCGGIENPHFGMSRGQLCVDLKIDKFDKLHMRGQHEWERSNSVLVECRVCLLSDGDYAHSCSSKMYAAAKHTSGEFYDK